MDLGSSLVPAAGTFIIGLALGAAFQRSYFCTMGCVSDVVLFHSFRRMRVWALAIAVALAGGQALNSVGVVDLGRSVYWQHVWLWPAALPGGVLFGFGMVLAGGCVSRNLVRLGAGSLKALTALLAVTAAAVTTTAVLPEPPVFQAGTTSPSWALPVTLAVAAALLSFCFRHPGFGRSRGDLATGVILGALVAAGWLITSPAGAQPDSLNFLALDRAGLVLSLAVGTVLGALAVALVRREFHLEWFTAAGDLRRHLIGGLLMGIGGTLALGCTIGLGITGVSTLSPGSLLALAGVLGGAWWGVKHLETRRVLPPIPFVRELRRRQLDVADTAD
jgi:hypothetical protein